MNSFEACLKAVKRHSLGFRVRVEGNTIIAENDLLIETISFSYHVKTKEVKA